MAMFQRKTLENDDQLEFGTSKSLAPDLVNNFTLGFSMKETIPAIGFAIKHHPFIVDSSIQLDMYMIYIVIYIYIWIVYIIYK